MFVLVLVFVQWMSQLKDLASERRCREQLEKKAGRNPQNDTYRLERDWNDWRRIPSPLQSNFENPAVTYCTAVLLMRVYKLYGFFEILPDVLSLEFDVVEAC